MSCLTQLLPLTCNGTLDEEVGDQAGVGQQGLGDRGGGLVLQPVLHGGPLICVPICSYYGIHHHCLHMHMLVLFSQLLYQQKCFAFGGPCGICRIALLMRPVLLLLLATVTNIFDATCN